MGTVGNTAGGVALCLCLGAAPASAEVYMMNCVQAQPTPSENRYQVLFDTANGTFVVNTFRRLIPFKVLSSRVTLEYIFVEGETPAGSGFLARFANPAWYVRHPVPDGSTAPSPYLSNQDTGIADVCVIAR